jgi:hypothetical protein
MPAARPKKESNSATPPSDDSHPKESHSENSKSKRKYVDVVPIFLRAAFYRVLRPSSPRIPPHIISPHSLVFSSCKVALHVILIPLFSE